MHLVADTRHAIRFVGDGDRLIDPCLAIDEVAALRGGKYFSRMSQPHLTVVDLDASAGVDACRLARSHQQRELSSP